MMNEQKRCLVFVVDDDEEDVMIVRCLLETTALDVDVQSAAGYQEAKHAFMAFKPDILLLDYDLRSNRTGIDLARWLWAIGDKTPILMVCGTDVRRLFGDHALHHLVDGVLSKNELSPKALEEQILRVL